MTVTDASDRAVDRLVRSAVEQGHSEHVDDATTIARVAALLREVPDDRAA